ncbi:MAG: hypothetical protein ACRCX7_12625 [Cetobacterium sp.]|uniref:hypothetical protein n=1 Tax=Cetobacterium sp. TaxID=2071632 RepID=UPI003F396681
MSKWREIERVKKDKAELEAALLSAETVEERNEIHLQLNEIEVYLGELYAINEEDEQYSGGDY